MAKFIREAWLVIVLAIACGFLVAAVYKLELPKIEQNKKTRLERAILAIVPDAARAEPLKADDLRGVYRVLDEAGRQVGWAVQTVANGFQGKIELVIGLTPDCRKITGIEVLESVETPGLGERINEDSFKGQFRNKSTDTPLEVVKKAPSRPNEIHAITAATISSRAVTEAVNACVSRVRERLAKEAAHR